MLDYLENSKGAYEGDDSSDGVDLDNPDSVKHKFQSSTWLHLNSTFSPPPKVFVGASRPTAKFLVMPTFMQLLSLFWPYTLLRKIVIESNRYATTLDENGNTRGGRMVIFDCSNVEGVFNYLHVDGVEKTTEHEDQL